MTTKEKSGTNQRSGEELRASQQMISSSAGALLVSLFTTPFDVVKVRLQAGIKPNSKGAPGVASSPKTILLQIIRAEGVGRLWKGLTPTLVQMVPQTVIYFTVYDRLKLKFGYVTGEKNVLPSFNAGVTARVFAVFAMSPLEMVRTKFQSKKGLSYPQLVLLVIASIRLEGLTSLWRGIGPTLLRDVPFSAFYWVCYEYLKSMNTNPNIFTNFTSGAMAGMSAAFLTTPFDVVKTFRQMELGEEKQKNQYGGGKLPLTFKIIRHLIKTQGVTSLYTGLAPRLVKVAPACAIMISTYEYGKQYFTEKNAILE